MKNSLRILLAILVLFAMLLPRAANLTKFTAADEPFWLVVGANYYYALTHDEFENTVYEYHPAVTTMWIGTAAMLIYFPEYRGLMDGYFQQEKTSFDTFLVEHGKNPLTLLWWARLIQLSLNMFLFIVAFFLLRSLLDEWIAFVILLLASFAPYLFGQSRMLNHESMVGLFSLIAILAMTAHLFLKPKTGLLILSAGSAALANLTKSSAIALLPVIAVIIFVWAVLGWRDQLMSLRGRSFSSPEAISTSMRRLLRHKSNAPHSDIFIWNAFKIFFAWIGILFLVYFIAWPGMWVAPGKMLYEVYGNAFSYAFQGARLSVTQELEPSNFSLASAGLGVFDFLASIAWRTTPVTWLGLLFAIIFLFSKNRELVPLLAKYLTSFLLLEAFACIGMFALVQGRDQPHYVLASYYGFEFVAALGWAYTLRWLAQKFTWAGTLFAQVALFSAILVMQVLGLFYTAPYYYTYLNPIMLAANKAPNFFYGEKMEEAAAYLAKKPNAENLTALVYFGRSFSYYFPGQTLLFKPILFDDKPQLIENLQQADYLVVYIGLDERLPLLKELTPEHIIDLNGRQYVEIYRVDDIPASFYK
jgi:hypothetical protein